MYFVLDESNLNVKFFLLVQKVSSHPPTTTEESSQNSDVCDTKSLSPSISMSEMSVEVETKNFIEHVKVKMEIVEEQQNNISHKEESPEDNKDEHCDDKNELFNAKDGHIVSKDKQTDVKDGNDTKDELLVSFIVI